MGSVNYKWLGSYLLMASSYFKLTMRNFKLWLMIFFFKNWGTFIPGDTYILDIRELPNFYLKEMDKIYAMTSNFSQVILPIIVFGGLGLGALAFVDSINYRTNLCNKVSFYEKY